MSMAETGIKHTELSLTGRTSSLAPLAVAAVARLGSVGAAVLGGLLWITLALFGL